MIKVFSKSIQIQKTSMLYKICLKVINEIGEDFTEVMGGTFAVI